MKREINRAFTVSNTFGSERKPTELDYLTIKTINKTLFC